LSAFGKLQAQVTAAFASIDSEVSTRQSEISRVDGRIDTEVTDRQTAVSALQIALDNEISDRASEVSILNGRVDTEISDRLADVQSVRDVTDNHEGRLSSAETTIAGLGTMSTQNANAVNITGGSISGVTLNAQSMEVGQGGTADLNGNIDILGGQVKNLGTPVDSTDAATKGYVDTAVSGVQSALDSEISDRTSEVSRLDGRITVLANDLDSAITAEQSARAAAVSAEETRALAAEAALEDTKQIKLVVSETAPAHIDGREWLDTTDFRRYISISNAWVESITA
jgi:chromosome segregation ATPase